MHENISSPACGATTTAPNPGPEYTVHAYYKIVHSGFNKPGPVWSFFCTGVAVGTEFCHAKSLPITDPTRWTFTIFEHNVMDPQTEYTSITIITSCTVLAFILGTTCGLVIGCYCCLIRKRNVEQRETSAIYDESMDHQSSQASSRMPHSQMELTTSRNVAYGSQT